MAAKESLQNGLELPDDVYLMIIRKRIEELLSENDRILRIQEILKNFDFLDHWTANDGKFVCIFFN